MLDNCKKETVVLTELITLPNSGAKGLIVTLNRPDRLNCFNTQVCASLSDIFYNVSQQIDKLDSQFPSSSSNDENENENDLGEIVAVILTGAGRSFCAGADLTNPPDPLKQSSDLTNHLMRNPVYHMGQIKVPIIGAIQGHCVTGGFELALACDILVGDSSTKFKDTHTKFGLAPCWGLSQKLQRRIGPGRAKLLSFTASALSGSKAYEWGLLDDFVTSANDNNNNNIIINNNNIKVSVLGRAIEIADQIAENDAKMVRRYKRAIVEGGDTDLKTGLQRERELAFAHYWEATGDNSTTFDDAKDFITDENRIRSKL